MYTRVAIQEEKAFIKLYLSFNIHHCNSRELKTLFRDTLIKKRKELIVQNLNINFKALINVNDISNFIKKKHIAELQGYTQFV